MFGNHGLAGEQRRSNIIISTELLSKIPHPSGSGILHFARRNKKIKEPFLALTHLLPANNHRAGFEILSLEFKN
jgi:hypothetical protein